MRIGDTSGSLWRRHHLELIAECDDDERILAVLLRAIQQGGYLTAGSHALPIPASKGEPPKPKPLRGLAGADAEYRPRGADAACDVGE